MSETYNALEGTYTVRGAGTTVRAGTTNAVALVGGYDAPNADSSVSAGDATPVDDPANASTLFGDSELARATQAVAANGVNTIYGVPVAETETTESFTATQSITLSETPVFDPTVHPDHEITVTDTSAGADIDTEIVYDDTPTTPSESDLAYVNPINGTIEIDSSSDYDVTYTYGDYQPAIDTAADLNVRYVIGLTESPSVATTLLTEVSDRAADFDFKRAIAGATPDISPTEISNYSPHQNDMRYIEVAPARATGADGPVRTATAVGGLLAGQPIGPDGSVLFDAVGGITSLATTYRPSEVKDFDTVTAVTGDGLIGTATTTSTEPQFQDIYATEIIDDVGSSLFETARSYAGGPQDLGELQALLNVQCQSFAQGNPPHLGRASVGDTQRPYDVSVSLGATDDVANAAVTIIPYPIAETVNLNLTVADGFVQFEGAN